MAISFIKNGIIKAGFMLGIFSILGVGLVSIIYSLTHDQIVENERNLILKNLAELVSPQWHDNHLLDDTIQVTDLKSLGSKKPITLYRAYKEDKPVAIIFTPVAPDGYSGSIRLLVAIMKDGQLAGVRVVSHRETPGLGDAIDSNKSNWIYSFNGLSLANTPAKNWKVKRDGGQFDQFTGATITPRAVTKAVYKTLEYYRLHKDELYKRSSTEAQGE